MAFVINDRVKERNTYRIHGGYINRNGQQRLIETRKGVVKGIYVKKNSVGASVTHYQVLWDNQSRLTEIQGHRIEHEVI